MKKQVPKNKNQSSTDISDISNWGYVEISSLVQRLKNLHQLADRIDELYTADNKDVGMMQINLRLAYILEFEQEYEVIFGKAKKYSNYMKMRTA